MNTSIHWDNVSYLQLDIGNITSRDGVCAPLDFLTSEKKTGLSNFFRLWPFWGDFKKHPFQGSLSDLYLGNQKVTNGGSWAAYCTHIPSKFNSKSPWKMMVERWSFPFGFRPIFRGKLAVKLPGSKSRNHSIGLHLPSIGLHRDSSGFIFPKQSLGEHAPPPKNVQKTTTKLSFFWDWEIYPT